MRQSSKITLKRAIVHLVSPKKADPTLSQRALPGNRMGELHDFFAGHIENSLGDEESKAARFDRGTENPIVVNCLPSVFGTSMQFTKATQSIASHLQSVVSLDKRISPGALVCCSYTAKSPGLRDTEFLALIKLDPTEGYQTQTTTDARGKTYVTLMSLNDVVPTIRERVQKCAFIRTHQAASRKYDLMVLDRQGRSRDAVAAFFVDNFLKATIVADATQNTKDFWLAAWGGLNEIQVAIGPKKTALVRKAMETAVNSPQIDVDQWVKTLPVPTQYQNAMQSALVARLDDRTIKTDSVVASNFGRKHVYKGQGGFKLTFESALEDEILKSPPKFVDDPKYGQVYELTVRVKDLKTVRS